MLNYKHINIFFLFFIICLINIQTTFSYSSIKKFISNQEEVTSGFTYRTILFEKIDKQNTELKPDADSSPLRVSKEEIGRFTWTFLHSVAAAYPKIPTDEQKTHLLNLLNSIAALYPCKECGSHFTKLLKQFPIKNSSRSELVNYLCEIHNEVNKKLNKPIFDCAKAAGYWGGDCGCGAN